MRAVKRARRFILSNPEQPTAIVLAQLILSLESESPFQIQKIYALDLDNFDLAIEILKEWRLDRYYEGKAKLLDAAFQLKELP